MKTLKKYIPKNIKLVSAVLVAGLIIGFGMGRIGGSADEHSGHQHEVETTEQEYTCSMHPQIRQKGPGLCPICAMELVPVVTSDSQSEHTDPNEIAMSETAMALASVETAEVQKGIPQKEIRLLGKVHADERRISEITARFGGRIEALKVNFTGQKVRKGQVLAQVYSPELIRAQRELLEALKFKESNPSFYRATRTKLKLWDLSEQQIDAIEQKGEPILKLNITAPMSGTVTKRQIASGDYIKEGSPLFELVDLSTVWILFDAYESDLPWIKTGDKVAFNFQSMPGESHTGTVSFIDPFIDQQTRITKLRIVVPNTEGKLKPEMFANGLLHASASQHTNELMIPRTSILWTGKRSIVYVQVPDREKVSFMSREVELGPSAGQFYIVKSGLKAGERIAVNGVFKIDAAAQLAGKRSMMNPQSKAMPTAHDHSEMDMPDKNTALEQSAFSVAGNCSMCKSTIESSAKALDGVNFAEWNQSSKQFSVSFNPGKTSIETIHKAIAKAGYDTDKEKAPDDVYEALPTCCKYRN